MQWQIESKSHVIGDIEIGYLKRFGVPVLVVVWIAKVGCLVYGLGGSRCYICIFADLMVFRS